MEKKNEHPEKYFINIQISVCQCAMRHCAGYKTARIKPLACLSV
jgi:hypothetical protein